MAEPRFDIFRGIPFEKDAIWVETVEGLANARERMEKLAAEKPGRYFVFAPLSRSILALADTTPEPKQDNRRNTA